MVSEERIKELMTESLPKCPLCGSDSGYNVTSVFKGSVQCKSCKSEWSSPDFIKSTELKNLKIKELPGGVYSCVRGEHVLKRHEEYPIGFWRSLVKTGSQPLSRLESYGQVKKTIFKVFIVFLIALIPRMFFVDETSIMTDEPLYVSAGQNYIQSFLGLDFSTDVWRKNAEHPPIAKLLIGLASNLFIPLLGGESTHNIYFAARMAPVTAGTLTCVAIYLFGRKCYGEAPAFLASLLTATSPWLVYYSTLAILDIFASFFVTLTFIFLCYAKTSNRYYILVGVFLGLAVGSKGTAVAAIPGIILYLFILKLLSRRKKEKEKVHSTRESLKQILLTPVIAMLVFFVTWPWLWKDTFTSAIWVLGYHAGHMTRGHTTFYAGRVYAHVPPWVPTYILFVKTPLLTFVLYALFMLFMFAKFAKKHPVEYGYINVFSWLTGGILTMSAFPIVIGDHYLTFLGPAVFISASVLAVDLLKLAKNSNVKFPKTVIMPYALILLMVTECLAGLVTYNLSPCGYASELVVQADKAVLMIDTGFEDVAEYLIEHGEGSARVAVAYNVGLLRIELNRKDEAGFELVSLEELSDAEYAVFPSIHTQRWGIPAEVKNEWDLVYVARSGESILSYVFKAPT